MDWKIRIWPWSEIDRLRGEVVNQQNAWNRITARLDLPPDCSAMKVMETILRLERHGDCEHTHTFKWDLPEACWMNHEGKNQGKHGSIQICGCYICGKMWCRDYAA